MKNQVSMQKINTIVADDNSTIKLILWEQLIDSVHTGLSYHFNNLTIRIFDDEKFVNSNELIITLLRIARKLTFEYDQMSVTSKIPKNYKQNGQVSYDHRGNERNLSNCV